MDQLITEEGIPVRTIYVPDLSINIKNLALTNYFRKFGAIERTQIWGQRLRPHEMFTTTPSLDGPSQQRKYFAYVTFANTQFACEALKEPVHTISDHTVKIEPAYSWNQAPIDVQNYLRRFEIGNHEETQLFKAMETQLNLDCCLQIMSNLGAFEILRMARSSESLKLFAHCLTSIRMERRDRDDRMSLMQLREFLKLLGIGANVTNLYISMRLFGMEEQSRVCERLSWYLGAQLRALTLSSFKLSETEFDELKTIFNSLEKFDADFQNIFDYRRLNCEWPKLDSLSIRTYGQLTHFMDDPENLPAFPLLTKLVVYCVFRTDQHFFEQLVRVCPKLTELVTISLYDYFAEIPPNNADFNHLSGFTNLVKLHLSYPRKHFPNKFMDVICQLKKLQHFTIDVGKSRIGDDPHFAEVSQNLGHLATNLTELKEIQLCGVAIDRPHYMQLIERAVNLTYIRINDCPGFILNESIIRSITQKRTELGRVSQPLVMDIDEAIYKELPQGLVGEDSKKDGRLVVIKSSKRKMIHAKYVSDEEMQILEERKYKPEPPRDPNQPAMNFDMFNRRRQMLHGIRFRMRDFPEADLDLEPVRNVDSDSDSSDMGLDDN